MKFITIQKQALEPKTIYITSKAYFDGDQGEVLETIDIEVLKESLRIPPQALNIRVGRYITEVLLKAITPSFLRGSEITINNVKFNICKSNPQYFYSWTEKIPSSLPKNLLDAYKTYQLRGELYNLLVNWNQSRIELAKEASKFKWNLAEEFYKNIYKVFHRNITVMSPNKKTFFEATAELAFTNWCPEAQPLSEAEERNINIINSRNYARAFGLQGTEIQFSFRHRTTQHGTTEEITMVSDADINNAINSDAYMRHTKQRREGYMNDDGFEVFSWLQKSKHTTTSHTKERENIKTIKWILSQSKETQEELLLPGWHFCPICNKLYHENEGCYTYDRNGNEIVHIEPVEFVSYNENHYDEDELEY